MQFACLTQIVVRFAFVQHSVCNSSLPHLPSLNCNEVYLLTIVCLGQKESRQLTGRTVVQDNNEALLSLSLSSITLFAFAFVLHQLHCKFYLYLPLSITLTLSLSLFCRCPIFYLHPHLRLAHLHTFTQTHRHTHAHVACRFLLHKEPSLVAACLGHKGQTDSRATGNRQHAAPAS